MPKAHILLLVATLTTSAPLLQAEEYRSTYWPEMVQLTNSLENESVSGQMVTLKSRTNGVLQRLEGESLIVDFGRNGIHRLPLEVTDFNKRYEAIRSNPAEKRFPNFSKQLASRLAAFPDGNRSYVTLDDHTKKKAYLVFYPGDHAPANILVAKTLDEMIPKMEPIQFLALPGDMHWYAYAVRSLEHLPLMFPHLTEGYRISFHHVPMDEPSFVMVDPNGKILYRSPTLAPDNHLRRNRLESRRFFNKRRMAAVYKALREAQAAVDAL